MITAGIMTGTSLDGVDVALVDVTGTGRELRLEVLHHQVFPLPSDLKADLESAMGAAPGTNPAPASMIGSLDARLAALYAACTRAALREAGLPTERLGLVGSHGQTLWHAPDADPPYTLQAGNPSMLAHLLSVPVVGDFRTGDVALGGQGAPLVPYVDWCLYTHPAEYRILLNLGGIANMTLLPPNAERGAVRAFDTGPANRLIDGAMQRLFNESFDEGGARAASGRPDETLLAAWLDHPWFHLAPPKSTGRELFSDAYLDKRLAEARAANLSPEDTIATLTALTVRSITDAIRTYAPGADHLYVSGGGAHNRTLLAGLRQGLDASGTHPLPVSPLSELGADVDAKEAICFAVLAHEAWNGVATGMPSVTGARGVAFQGVLCPSHPQTHPTT
ncbi:MAG: anhydro-N-acetylmuramic acid kinase [Rhodothermales bacterium]